MFCFLLQKMKSMKWMFLCLLLGNLLLVAIAAANPLYANAVMQRTLTQDLSEELLRTNRYPGTIYLQKDHRQTDPVDLSDLDHCKQILDTTLNTLQLPSLAQSVSYSKNNLFAVSPTSADGETDRIFDLASYSGLAEHIQITHGEMYRSNIQDAVIDVIVTERTFVEQRLTLGEELELVYPRKEDGTPYHIRIAGIFESSSDSDPYWFTPPSHWSSMFLADEQILRTLFADPDQPSTGFTVTWHTVLDHTQMDASRVERTLEAIETALHALDGKRGTDITVYFQKTLEAYQPKSQKLQTTVTVLQVPIFLLLAAFILMVSRQMLENEQNEISVFQSRGASKKQILWIYLLQSLLIAGSSVAAGIPLGFCICRILGASNAFLTFVQRTSLPVKMVPAVWGFAAAAAVCSVCAMVLPVFRFANVTIVSHKRQKNRKVKGSWWQKIYLDMILLGTSIYGLYQFRTQEAYLAEQVLDGAALDPLLYLCSSLFILGAGLLFLRLLPWLIRLVFWIGKQMWPPAIYASFLRMIRSSGNQGFLVIFLVLTVALGIFSARTARTINVSEEDRIRYSIGADVVLQERWGDNASSVAADTSGLLKLTYTEPDYGKYLDLEGIEQSTRVLVDDKGTASVSVGNRIPARVMGIHTKEFGQTAWFKEDLLPAHWYTYLNAMSQNVNAILVSSNFQTQYGYQIGDVLNYAGNDGGSSRGVICGFVDYWPSYAPVTTTVHADGSITETDHFLIVAHLSQLQAGWGITPYQIWIKTQGSSQFLYDFAEATETRFVMFQDTDAELVRLKNDPVFQGTNGILTIGFIVVLLLCATGFLIYWILSIQSRTLQFGIFRAMGMSSGEILSMLVNEQLFISGTSICGGILVGQISADLFVPLIQIAYSSAEKIIPLEIVSAPGDYLRLGGVIGLMIAVCIVILAVLISKIRITQALKLGED